MRRTAAKHGWTFAHARDEIRYVEHKLEPEERAAFRLGVSLALREALRLDEGHVADLRATLRKEWDAHARVAVGGNK